MLQSTPMLSQQDSADTRACQRASASSVWTHTGTLDTQSLIAAVARAYNDAFYPEPTVTPAAILGPSRATHVAQARHLCAYLLVEDYHVTNVAAARVLGRSDHSTTVNSRARIVAALPYDNALNRVLTRVRAELAGDNRDKRPRPRHDEDRRRDFAVATPRELAEYRYWRLRSLRADDMGIWGGA
jgi:hypothetical protein